MSARINDSEVSMNQRRSIRYSQRIMILSLFFLFTIILSSQPYHGVKADEAPPPGTTSYLDTDSGQQSQNSTKAASSLYGEIKYFQSFEVHGGYVAAGVGMRNRGYGTIVLTGIPTGARTLAAYLYWDILSSELDSTYEKGVLNGHSITGKLIGTHGDPCWGNTTNYAYRADVTTLVGGNGNYSLSGFASGLTDGTDPWISGSTPPMTEGASLVVVYDGPGLAHTRVFLYDGSILSAGNQASVTLDHFSVSDSLTKAMTTFIGADGQIASEDDSTFNGVSLPSVGWDGNDPQDGDNFSNGNLWDTMVVDVTQLLPSGSTSATATVGPGNDCLVWTTQVLSLSDNQAETDCSNANLDRQPLLLIHGWGGPDTIQEDKMGFGQLQTHLTNDLGYVLDCNLFYAKGVKASFNPYFNSASISANLRYAYSRMKEIDPDWRGHFDLIGHSYGGLNARFYLESKAYKLDQSYKDYGIHVDNLFTMGSPHGGVDLDHELYPGAAWIGLGHIFKEEELMSANNLLKEQMDDYNQNHNQPENVCYRLIGGDFIHQPYLMNTSPEVYLLYKNFSTSLNDIGISVRSSLHLALDDSLKSRYPNVVGNLNVDMHGYIEKYGLENVWSYVRPNRTFDNFILPFLDPGPNACEQNAQAQQPSSANSTQDENPSSPTLVETGELLPDQIIAGTLPVDWPGKSAFYASTLDGILNLRLWDANGMEVNPSIADTDPNISYFSAPYGTSSLVTYLFTDTVPGAWIYEITNPTSQAVPYDFYSISQSPLALKVEVPYWHQLNQPVLISATLAYSDTAFLGATLSAKVKMPDGTTNQVNLHDDGSQPDAQSGDGIYTGMYENTAEGGLYPILVEANGVINGNDFFRSTQAVFSVSSRKAIISEPSMDEALDIDGDGFFDQLNVLVGLNVNNPGVFSINGILQGSNQGEIAVSSTSITAITGTQTITLSFPASAIRLSGLNGPYSLARVSVMDDDTFIKQDEAENLLVTDPYYYWQFNTDHIAPASVSISGKSEGLAGEPYTFTASVPISTSLPITYVWNVAGQSLITHTGLLTDTLTATINDIGSIHVSVEAINKNGNAMATHLVAVAPRQIFLPILTTR
jgi:pimeloyl-ACP methyl ester carboxylesterase